jgi:predicted RecB family nuclease
MGHIISKLLKILKFKCKIFLQKSRVWPIISFMHITASVLYDYIQCPHRVWRDHYGPQEERIQETNPFVKLLWDKGIQHENKVIASLGKFEDLGEGSLEERFQKTLSAMRSGVPLIYQGVIKHDNLLGIPDLLKKLENGNYIPLDIKSGRGMDGVDENEEDEGKPKKHYAVQLCLYAEVLQKLGFAKERHGMVIDITGREIFYDLGLPQGPRKPETWWEAYQEAKQEVHLLLENRAQNKPALAGVCKLCHWYNSCKKWCKESHDLTNIFYLGRSKRDVINQDLGIERLEQFRVMTDLDPIVERKKGDKSFLSGIGEKTLEKLIARSRILFKKEPVLYQAIDFPKTDLELYFDIESDPTQDFIYLHGVYERYAGKEKFIYFLAKENTREAEKKAWQEFWNYIRSLPHQNYAVYYYSSYERTTYRKMRELYPDVVSQEELENFFARPMTKDLYYDVVYKYTDWPLSSYSIKDIATYLGFRWRDETPSGALSIQWYNEYIQKKEPALLKRILEYNEDDCKATLVLKDGLEKLSRAFQAKSAR